MKRILTLLGFCGAFTSVLALPSYEPFADATASGGTAYAAGTSLFRQTNAMGDIWFACNGTSTTTCVSNAPGSLSYPGLPASAGNSIKLRNVSGTGARIFVATNSSGFFVGNAAHVTVYYSMLLRVEDITALSTSGDFCFGFNNQGTIADQSGQPTIQSARVYFLKSDPNYQLGIYKGSSVAYDSTLRSAGETLFIVVGYEMNTGSSTDDNVRLWINPDSATFGTPNPPAENASVLGIDADINTLNSFVFLHRSTTMPNAMVADDFRMGKTWAFVTGGPEVTVAPIASTNVSYLGSFNLSVAAKSGGPSALTYQWRKNAANLVNGGNVSGATSASLTISSASSADAGTYSVIVSNATGGVTNFTTVAVADPVITTQPTNQVVAPGNAAHFNLAATGTPTLTYRWQREGTNLVNGGNISGSTTPSLTVSSASAADVATYGCLVTNGLGSATASSNATLTLVDPGLATEPQNLTTNFGATANFTAVAVGTPPLNYRWQKDGVDLANGPSASGAIILGVTSTNLTIAGVAYQDAGNYSVNVTNGLGSVASSASAALVVNDPYISTQPVSQTNAFGTTATFSATASGTPPLTYAWQKNGSPLSDGGNISGAASNTLTISSVTLADVGNYNLVVSGGSGSNAVSATVALKVTLSPGQPIYWDANGSAAGAGDTPNGDWTTNNFWTTDASGGLVTGGWSDGGTAVFSAGTDAVNPFTVTVSQTAIVAGITIEEGTPTITGSTLVFSATNGQAEINVANALAGTIASVISGTNDLVKTGSGQITLAAANIYTGRNIIKEGTFQLQNDNRLGSVPTGPVSDSITLDGGIMDWINTGAQTVNANRGFSITTNNGTVTKSTGSAAVTIAGGITGPGKLTKSGLGTLTLTSSNSFAGGLDVLGGQANLNSLNLFTGAGWLTFAGGSGVIQLADGVTFRAANLAVTGPVDPIVPNSTVIVSNAIVLLGGLATVGPGGGGVQPHVNYAGVISGPGGIIRQNVGDKIMILSGNNTFSGGVRLLQRPLALGHKNAVGTGVLTIGDEFTPPANQIRLEAAINLYGANAITNPVVFNQQVSLTSAENMPYGLELSGPIELGNPNVPIFCNQSAGATLVPNLTNIFSGVISSANGYDFTKQGNGTLILSGANTYAGGTTVAAGRLIVNNTSGSGTGTGGVTVNSGALLGGSGTITGAVTVAGGTISAGSSAGKLTLQSGLDMSAGGTNAWELAAPKDDSTGVAGADFDQLAVTDGAINLNNATVAISFTGAATAPDPASAFWQANHTWTILKLSGGASNPGSSSFAGILNGSVAAGNFTTQVAGDGSIQLKFTAVPALTIQSISGTASSATISWNSVNGANYQVLYNTNLNTTNWLVLTNVTGNGGLKAITDAHGTDPQRFYRLTLVP